MSLADRPHVVVGATGALGTAVVRALVRARAPVRAVVRDQLRGRRWLPPEVRLLEVDVLDPAGLEAACEGAAAVYHCVQVPPREWGRVLPRATDLLLRFAGQEGAVLVFPGDPVVYGPLQRVPATEDHPWAAIGARGRQRGVLEARLLGAHARGEARVVVPRFPELYGPHVLNALMEEVFRDVLDGRGVWWPGDLDAPRDFLYVDDAAEACVRLADARDTWGRAWHVPGPGAEPPREFLERVFRMAHLPANVHAAPRALARLAERLGPDPQEAEELRHAYEGPLVLDGSRFGARFPGFRYMPHDAGVLRTLDWFRDYLGGHAPAVALPMVLR